VPEIDIQQATIGNSKKVESEKGVQYFHPSIERAKMKIEDE